MKKMTWGGLAAVVLMTGCSQQAETPKEVSLISEQDKFSYAIGLDVGNSLKGMNRGINLDAFMAAVRVQMEGGEPRLTQQEAGEAKQAFFKERADQQAAERKKSGEKNMQEGKAFLAENVKKEGVTATASGLQYQVITMGDGAKPKATDSVEVHYRGTLLDGTEFDSSYKRGQPISFPLNGVIKGWTEGLQLMPVGSKFKFFIPSELGYGERGAGAAIGPNATLIFEVELLSIKG
ncbi:MAG: FKBP-type peptidyl-prolyl cis-trans isomerase [Mariprofundaceae bacterium]